MSFGQDDGRRVLRDVVSDDGGDRGRELTLTPVILHCEPVKSGSNAGAPHYERCLIVFYA